MDASTLRALGVEYDPMTGIVTTHGIVARARKGNGYIGLNVGNRSYYAHRVAWMFVHGRWPASDIDHINRDKSDNRIANLREATRSENQRNHPLSVTNTSGHKGVRMNKRRGVWVAYIRINTKQTHLGSFASLGDAVAARRKAEADHFGEFAYREAT